MTNLKNELPAGFTYSIFGQDFMMVMDFIWGYLYDKGLQYKCPYSDVATKQIILIHEQG